MLASFHVFLNHSKIFCCEAFVQIFGTFLTIIYFLMISCDITEFFIFSGCEPIFRYMFCTYLLSVCFPFFLNCAFWRAKVFKTEVHFSKCFFHGLCFCVLLKKPWPNSMPRRFSPVFSCWSIYVEVRALMLSLWSMLSEIWLSGKHGGSFFFFF